MTVTFWLLWGVTMIGWLITAYRLTEIQGNLDIIERWIKEHAQHHINKEC